MSPVPSEQLLASYWGKADPNSATPTDDHHTVLGHSLDVAACAFAIVQRNPALRTQFARTTGTSAEAVAVTLAAVCALHDVGAHSAHRDHQDRRIVITVIGHRDHVSERSDEQSRQEWA